LSFSNDLIDRLIAWLWSHHQQYFLTGCLVTSTATPLDDGRSSITHGGPCYSLSFVHISASGFFLPASRLLTFGILINFLTALGPFQISYVSLRLFGIYPLSATAITSAAVVAVVALRPATMVRWRSAKHTLSAIQELIQASLRHGGPESEEGVEFIGAINGLGRVLHYSAFIEFRAIRTKHGKH
jgi:hypothetical protein